nr:DGQHR domain-containing protein [Amaricoccus macauensis]
MPINIPVSKVSQPIGDFYVGCIDARTLVGISYTEIRAFISGTQGKIAGIQRERSEKRIKSIEKYVNLDYATFPTSVIIAVAAECVELTPYCTNATKSNSKGIFNLELTTYGSPGDNDYIPVEKIAFIIDGQHRVAGLEGLDNHRNFDVNISIFVGASEADKAEIFARVNQAQTKVNQSLVVDLASYYEERGPVKFAHEVVLAMNRDVEGPLHDKIKRLGKAEPGKGMVQTLAQATVVKPIVEYITPDPESERNKRYKGLFGLKRNPDDWRTFIFQPFFDKNDDSGLFLCLTNFFNAVKYKWPSCWDNAPTGSILNRTTGYVALMRFFRPLYLKHCERGEVLPFEVCRKTFERISIEDGELTRDLFVPGSSGISALYRRLIIDAGLEQ